MNRLTTRKIDLVNGQLALLWLLLACLVSLVHAGDEDMNPSIYQRFDPETGFMIPIDPAQQPGHTPAAPVVAEPAQAVDTAIAPAPEAQAARRSQLWGPALAGLIGLLVIITLIRKNRPVRAGRMD